MPKIDIGTVPERKGSGYPSQFNAPCAERVRQRLGDAGGLTDFGINLMRLPPGNWSSRRHWHSHEDEFVYVLEGELTLIEDGGETVLRAGDCAAFAKGSGNGHHLINRSATMAVHLEVGSRQPADVTTCSDIDMMSTNADGRFVHKHGTPYTDPWNPASEVRRQVRECTVQHCSRCCRSGRRHRRTRIAGRSAGCGRAAAGSCACHRRTAATSCGA